MHQENLIGSIKQKIRFLYLTAIFITSTLIFIVIKYLYDFLEYIPKASIAAMLSITAALVLAIAYISNTVLKRTLKEIDYYDSKIKGILAGTREIREIRYPDLLLDKILELSLGLSNTDTGAILLFEGDQLVFKTILHHGNRIPAVSAIHKQENFFENTAAGNASAVFNDASGDGKTPSALGMLIKNETAPALCIPLDASGKVIGLIELIGKGKDDFKSEEIEIIRYFAYQAGTSIERARHFEDERNFQIHTLNLFLEALDTLMPEKSGHSKRVAKNALIMAKAVQMPEEQMKGLYNAALLHDIGFLKLRNAYSKSTYMSHPVVGHEMLSQINLFAPLAGIVLHHHERYDGKGYPDGLAKEAIPLEARMIAIAEAFDAMVSTDSYKYRDKRVGLDGPLGHQNALAELKANAGTQFDPELTEVFIKNITEESIREVYDIKI